MKTSVRPGRTCPLGYRYLAAAIMAGPSPDLDTLWIAGGLYGNPFALRALLDRYDADRGSKALAFNGDFHWFDADVADFLLVNDTVLGFHALRGNVETEIAAPGDNAGCGCGYPEWVGDETVEHSNRIIERLQATARRSGVDLARLADLPMYLGARVGNVAIGIVHGDYASLAGWGFSQEALATPRGFGDAAAAFAAAGVGIFASTHTCLPVLQRFGDGAILVNNGAAGMPNFRGTSWGLATRISVRASREALYSARCGEVVVEAIPLRYDDRAWRERFLAQWPRGSDAHRSYWGRITNGPAYETGQALRLEPPAWRAGNRAGAVPADPDSGAKTPGAR